jgi:hypothetical protein
MQKNGAAEPRRRISKLHNNIAMMIAGAIMLVMGTMVSAYLGSVFVHDYASAACPYPGYGIISPLYTQIAFIFIAITGLGLIVWGLGGTQWANHNICTIICITVACFLRLHFQSPGGSG